MLKVALTALAALLVITPVLADEQTVKAFRMIQCLRP